MKKHFSFEIVRRGFRRFSWVLVEERDGHRRVLARSHRDYRKKKKVEDALADFRQGVADALVVDASGWPQGHDEVDATFELAPYVVSLVVGEPVRRRGRPRNSGFFTVGGPGAAPTAPATKTASATKSVSAATKATPAAKAAAKKTAPAGKKTAPAAKKAARRAAARTRGQRQSSTP